MKKQLLLISILFADTLLVGNISVDHPRFRDEQEFLDIRTKAHINKHGILRAYSKNGENDLIKKIQQLETNFNTGIKEAAKNMAALCDYCDSQSILLNNILEEIYKIKHQNEHENKSSNFRNVFEEYLRQQNHEKSDIEDIVSQVFNDPTYDVGNLFHNQDDDQIKELIQGYKSLSTYRHCEKDALVKKIKRLRKNFKTGIKDAAENMDELCDYCDKQGIVLNDILEEIYKIKHKNERENKSSNFRNVFVKYLLQNHEESVNESRTSSKRSFSSIDDNTDSNDCNVMVSKKECLTESKPEIESAIVNEEDSDYGDCIRKLFHNSDEDLDDCEDDNSAKESEVAISNGQNPSIMQRFISSIKRVFVGWNNLDSFDEGDNSKKRRLDIK